MSSSRIRDWLPPAEQDIVDAGAQVESYRTSPVARVGWTVLAVAVLVGALATGIFQFWTLSQRHEVRDRVTLAENPKTVVIADVGSSDVTVVGHSGSTQIVLERELRTASEDPAPDISTDGDRMTIDSWCGPGMCSGSLVLHVPAGIDLEIESASGDLSVEGVTGSVSAHADSGNVSLSGLGGQVDASTSSGDVELDDVAGPVVVDTASGDIDVSTASLAAAVLSADSGDVSVDVSSDIDSIDIETVSGDVSVDVPDGRDYQVDVPRDSSVSVPVDSSTTRVIVVDTTSGDVSID